MADRDLTFKIEIDWDFDAVYTDETAYFIRATGEYRIAAPGSSILSPRGRIPNMSLTLANDTGRFSPLNSNSPLYGSIQGGNAYHAPVRFWVGIDGGALERVFTGYLKVPTESTASTSAIREISFDCRGIEERVQQQQLSTQLSAFSAGYDAENYENTIIEEWLIQAGVSSNIGSIDPGIYPIRAAWLDEESPLEDIWSLAGGAGGWVFSDRFSDFHYYNATHLAYDTPPLATYTKGDYAQMTVRFDDSELFSEVTVEASPRFKSGETLLWEPDDIPQIPAGETVEVVATLRQPAYSITAITFDATTSGGKDLSGDIEFTADPYAQRINLSFTNSNATYGVVLRNLQVVGLPIVGEPTTEVTKTVADGDTFWVPTKFREQRSRSVRGNVYIQARAQAATLATMLCDWHDRPRPSLRISGVPGDPTLGLLDKVTITNGDVVTDPVDVFVTSIGWVASSNGFVQTIEGFDSEAFYPYADDADGYFVLGTNRLGASPGSDLGRLFY